MKFLFNLLKLFPAFQKLLSDFFEGERAELKKQIDDYEAQRKEACAAALKQRLRADAAEAEAEKLRAHIGTLEQVIQDRKVEIEELRNARTEKLQAVDSLPADDVWAGVLRPKPRP